MIKKNRDLESTAEAFRGQAQDNTQRYRHKPQIVN